MQCSNCGSDDVLLCSVAYQQGKIETQTKTTSSGSYGAGAGGGRMNARHTSTSTSLTEFAGRAAPPKPAFDGACMNVIAAVVALVIIPAAVSDVFHTQSAMLFYALLAVVAYTIYRLTIAYRNRPEDRARRDEWERSWICTRCGTMFLPETDTPGVSQAN